MPPPPRDMGIGSKKKIPENVSPMATPGGCPWISSTSPVKVTVAASDGSTNVHSTAAPNPAAKINLFICSCSLSTRSANLTLHGGHDLSRPTLESREHVWRSINQR